MEYIVTLNRRHEAAHFHQPLLQTNPHVPFFLFFLFFFLPPDAPPLALEVVLPCLLSPGVPSSPSPSSPSSSSSVVLGVWALGSASTGWPTASCFTSSYTFLASPTAANFCSSWCAPLTSASSRVFYIFYSSSNLCFASAFSFSAAIYLAWSSSCFFYAASNSFLCFSASSAFFLVSNSARRCFSASTVFFFSAASFSSLILASSSAFFWAISSSIRFFSTSAFALSAFTWSSFRFASSAAV